MSYYCTVGNRWNQESPEAKRVEMRINYKTKDSDCELSDEEMDILLELVEPRLVEIYTDIIKVFPEINGVDISINNSENNS